LNGAQQSDMCSVTLAAIDAQAGVKYECNTGPQSGLTLTVNTKDQCLANKAPAACDITVQQLIDCYKAAKTDACSAFAPTAACGPIFASKTCAG
jgi:hypothetical protein